MFFMHVLATDIRSNLSSFNKKKIRFAHLASVLFLLFFYLSLSFCFRNIIFLKLQYSQRWVHFFSFVPSYLSMAKFSMAKLIFECFTMIFSYEIIYYVGLCVCFVLLKSKVAKKVCNWMGEIESSFSRINVDQYEFKKRDWENIVR